MSRDVFCPVCRKVHAVPSYESNEWTEPRREGVKDVLLALGVWVLLLGALVSFYFWAWAAVAS